MRFSIPVVALFAANVLAVDISGAPQCAQTCLLDNQSQSACDPDAADATCFCADTAFYSLVSACVLGSCESGDILATLTWYGETCPSKRKARMLRV
ncbi:unnamed protein product [Periconia digitata]|uniref:CFEM domain-containing protein n=1 Tax=Periconia digitata TaxID=1303443 RepID=A0A9W4UBS7_9PLEO|nr:unnamed protein product [Periconia digitata]